MLDELGVRVVKLNTVFEKMSFDKETIVVQAGKPVEFVLENSDLMPHNFVIVAPGALEDVGTAAEAQAQDPKFAAANFVPNSPQVLAKSGLLPPRGSTRVGFTAPTTPGVYAYVCTYPGHWRRMYGALYVVPDMNEYEAAPEAYLTANKIEPLDALLKDRRPRTEWKLADLAAAVTALPDTGGRSHAGGLAAFKIANCAACHKVNDVGVEFGPDLTKLNKMYKPLDVLRHVLEPSERIDDKYRSFTYELTDGRTLTGMQVAETKDAYKVIENPLAKAEPIEVLKSTVDARTALPTSPMPKGLLDKLTRDEVLDLLAFLIARTDAEHAVFRKNGHEHGAHKH
ncbi:MAG: plastocyanin/azurin family copper-binding protein [Pirellulales bacterium]